MVAMGTPQSVGGLGACRLKLMPTVVGLCSAEEGPAAECKTLRGPTVPALKPLSPGPEGMWLWCAGAGIADSGLSHSSTREKLLGLLSRSQTIMMRQLIEL